MGCLLSWKRQAGSMPWRRLAAAAAGEAMKSSSARTASGCVEAAQTPPEKVVTIWSAVRHRPEHVDAVEVHQLAQLLEAQRHFAARDQRSHRHAGRRLHDAIANLVGDAPALEQLLQRHAARAGRIAERGRGEHRSPQRLLGAGLGSRRAGAHRDGDARLDQVDGGCWRARGPRRSACRSHRRRAPRRRTARPPARAWRHRRRRPIRMPTSMPLRCW